MNRLRSFNWLHAFKRDVDLIELIVELYAKQAKWNMVQLRVNSGLRTRLNRLEMQVKCLEDEK